MQKYVLLTACAAAIVTLTACSKAEPGSADTASVHTATFIANDRSETGTVVLTNTAGGVQAAIEIKGLTPGKHGMHFHKIGDCGDDKFKNSGGHINPNNHQHGLKNPDGPDNADLPNLVVDANGIGVQTVMNDRLSFTGEGGRPELFDEDGSALIIHANPDDQVTQPIGGAGARVACAVINR